MVVSGGAASMVEASNPAANRERKIIETSGSTGQEAYATEKQNRAQTGAVVSGTLLPTTVYPAVKRKGRVPDCSKIGKLLK